MLGFLIGVLVAVLGEGVLRFFNKDYIGTVVAFIKKLFPVS